MMLAAKKKGERSIHDNIWSFPEGISSRLGVENSWHNYGKRGFALLFGGRGKENLCWHVGAERGKLSLLEGWDSTPRGGKKENGWFLIDAACRSC